MHIEDFYRAFLMPQSAQPLRIIAAVLLLVCPMAASGQSGHTVVPIGNFADVTQVGRFARAILSLLDSIGGNQTLLFTGDLTDPRQSLEQSLARIDSFLQYLPPATNRRIVMIPGDRDWADSAPGGWQQVNTVASYILSKQRPDLIWPLQEGCPGPERVQLDLALHLIAINTQWWNHPHEKPTSESAVCAISTHDEAIEQIEKMIEEARYGNLLIAGHYPIISNGHYGGRYPLGRWLFPVPLVSGMITSYKQNIGTTRHISNGRYARFREKMEDILSEYPSLVYCSGHEYNREVLVLNESILVHSGVPESAGYVAQSPTTLYAGSSPGLMTLLYDLDGNAWVLNYTAGSTGYVFEKRMKILQAPCKTPMAGVQVNQRLVPCLDDRYVLPVMTTTPREHVSIAANPHYHAGPVKRMLLGEHYRKSWTTQVDVPEINLDQFAGGLIPYREGGGRQTKSLRFMADDGHEYVFRSVDKDPSKALAYNLRESLISLAVRDQTTTQHPYGALVASRLLDNLDILHAQPEVFVMPVDGKLGPFQHKFGGMIGMIEERPSGRKEVRSVFAGADEILGTAEMFQQLYRDRKHYIAKDEFAQARVFDILVGDWGKHEDNWKWAGFNASTGVVYRPIPRDRDHVFSRWDGAIPWLIDREWAKPSGENFDFRIKGLRSLMWQARHLDRLLGSELSRQDWLDAAHIVSRHISPNTIDSAIARLPEGVQQIHGQEIAAKLKTRISDLPLYAGQYYRMLAREVDVVGSNAADHFEAIRNPDGTVQVSVYHLQDGRRGERFYTRLFYPDETREIRLFGLQGDDVFDISGVSSTSILIRVIPGSGVTSLSDVSEVRRGGKNTRIYDLRGESHCLADSGEVHSMHIPYVDAYRYRRTAFAYNTYLPLAYMWFSSGNGLMIGSGIAFTRQSYDKPDFSAIHSIALRVSTLGNLQFEYDGRSRHVVGMWDLSFGGFIDKHTRLNYFFGTGSNTTLDRDLLRSDFYTLQYSRLQFHLGLSRMFWERSSFETGIVLAGSSRENLEGNLFEPGRFPDVAGDERLRLVKGRFRGELDFRDRTHLPRRGTRLIWEGLAAKALNDATNYANTLAILEVFSTLRSVTLGVRTGGALHWGVTPFYDFHYLGQNTYLRGFRQNRFTGDAIAFVNSDLRIQLVENRKALIPYKFGITLFFDTGHVFDSESGTITSGWHHGYGVGIYYVPLRERFALQVSLGFSDEERGLVRFGIGRNF